MAQLHNDGTRIQFSPDQIQAFLQSSFLKLATGHSYNKLLSVIFLTNFVTGKCKPFYFSSNFFLFKQKEPPPPWVAKGPVHFSTYPKIQSFTGTLIVNR